MLQLDHMHHSQMDVDMCISNLSAIHQKQKQSIYKSLQVKTDEYIQKQSASVHGLNKFRVIIYTNCKLGH